PSTGISNSSDFARKWVTPGTKLPINGWSMPEKWFAAITAPRSRGTRSTPYAAAGASASVTGCTSLRANRQRRSSSSPQIFGTPSRVSSTSLGPAVVLEQPQPVLELRDPKLRFLQLVARHEPELAKETGEP